MTKLQKQIEQFKYKRSRFYSSPKERLEFCDEFDALVRSAIEKCQMITKGPQSGVNPGIDLARKHLANDIAHEFAWLEEK